MYNEIIYDVESTTNFDGFIKDVVIWNYTEFYRYLNNKYKWKISNNSILLRNFNKEDNFKIYYKTIKTKDFFYYNYIYKIELITEKEIQNNVDLVPFNIELAKKIVNKEINGSIVYGKIQRYQAEILKFNLNTKEDKNILAIIKDNEGIEEPMLFFNDGTNTKDKGIISRNLRLFILLNKD